MVFIVVCHSDLYMHTCLNNILEKSSVFLSHLLKLSTDSFGPHWYLPQSVVSLFEFKLFDWFIKLSLDGVNAGLALIKCPKTCGSLYPPLSLLNVLCSFMMCIDSFITLLNLTVSLSFMSVCSQSIECSLCMAWSVMADLNILFSICFLCCLVFMEFFTSSTSFLCSLILVARGLPVSPM